jgi:YD repeat-containing protein
MTYDSSWRVTSIKRVSEATTTPHTGRRGRSTTPRPAPAAASPDTRPRSQPARKEHDLLLRPQLRVTDVYDANGNRRSAQYNENRNVKHIDTRGRPATTSAPSQTAPGTRARPITRPGERPRRPTGTARTPTSRPGHRSGGNAYDYSYDAPGNVLTTANGSSPTQIKATLTYKTFGAIAPATDGDDTWTYGYDAANNLTARTEGSGASDDRDEQLQAHPPDPRVPAHGVTNQYSYDGTVTRRVHHAGGTVTYSFDDELVRRPGNISGIMAGYAGLFAVAASSVGKIIFGVVATLCAVGLIVWEQLLNKRG